MDQLDRLKSLLNDGLSLAQIAKEMSVSRQWIYEVCRKNGIPYLGRHKIARTLVGKRDLPVKSGVAGVVSELITTCDLLVRGYDVYKQVINNSRGHDLLAVKEGRVMTVEVRTAWRLQDGSLRLPFKKDCASDVHAFVVANESVIYKPSLDE